ncbi:uncharacterized protein LAESUDRAFT_205191 [Laetiporus sulphureus 93-53]|uniref:Pentacotripeptide-repeat region of PRORP domain-containing protein n=1 Tax=Laetiporus sulphureus 93-53 TaxID=1314785 RepID=A0A165DYQ2_9APHY|nr:uncharacterized protein LAESUDRAFT_205191 [Laetiporus sulphureus 93-53]KZT05902.1 hypothetical protein LAESUDRAFT_205191 [Laetiporus sulphureus 93-53]
MLLRVVQLSRQAATCHLSVPCIARFSPLQIVHLLHHSAVPQWQPALTHRDGTPPSHGPPKDPGGDGKPLEKVERRRQLDLKGLQGHHPRKRSRHAEEGISPFTLIIDDLFRRLRSDPRVLDNVREEGAKKELLEHLTDRVKAAALAQLMVHTRNPRRAIGVLLLAYRLGCKFKQNAYEGVAHQLASSKHWRLVSSVFAMGKRQTGRTTVRMLNWHARALMETKEYVSLDKIIEIFEREGLLPNRRTYHILISAHLRNRDMFRAKQYLADMEKAGFPVDTSTHAIIVSSYRPLGPDPAVQAKALDVLREAAAPSSTVILNSLIQLSLDAGDLPAAYRYLNMCNQRAQHVKLRPVDGDDTTQAGGETPRLGSDRTGRPEATSPTSEPMYDVVTLTMMINHLAKEGDLSGIAHVLQLMDVTNIRPDSSMIAALVRAYVKAERLDLAMQTIAEMCRNHPEHERLRELLRLVGLANPEQKSAYAAEKINPSTEVFNAILPGVLKARGLQGMRIIQRIMRIVGVQYDEYTLQLLLSYLDKVEHARPRELIRWLRRLESRERPVSLRHLHTIMRILLRWEKKQSRLGARGKNSPLPMEDREAPDNTISDAVQSYDPVAGFVFPRKLSYRALVRPLLESLQSRGVKGDRAAFALRIRQDALIRADMEMAKQSFNAMSAIESGTRRSVLMYTILVWGYARLRKLAPALRMFRRIVAAGLQPDVVALHVLAQAFIAAKARGHARRLLLQLWPTVATFSDELQNASLEELMSKLASLSESGVRTRERYSKQRQRMLRWKVLRIIQRWQWSLPRGRRRREKTRPTHDVAIQTKDVVQQ